MVMLSGVSGENSFVGPWECIKGYTMRLIRYFVGIIVVVLVMIMVMVVV